MGTIPTKARTPTLPTKGNRLVPKLSNRCQQTPNSLSTRKYNYMRQPTTFRKHNRKLIKEQ